MIWLGVVYKTWQNRCKYMCSTNEYCGERNMCSTQLFLLRYQRMLFCCSMRLFWTVFVIVQLIAAFLALLFCFVSHLFVMPACYLYCYVLGIYYYTCMAVCHFVYLFIFFYFLLLYSHIFFFLHTYCVLYVLLYVCVAVCMLMC